MNTAYEEHEYDSAPLWEAQFIKTVREFLKVINNYLIENHIGLNIEYLDQLPNLGTYNPEKETSVETELHDRFKKESENKLPKEQIQGNLTNETLISNPNLAKEIGGLVGLQLQDNGKLRRTAAINLSSYSSESTYIEELNAIQSTTHAKMPDIESIRYMDKIIIWHTHPVLSHTSETDINSMLRTYQHIKKEMSEMGSIPEIFWAIYIPEKDKVTWYKITQR